MPFSSSQTDHSTRAPNPKAFRARYRRWEEMIPLAAGTRAMITVSIRLVCGTDHPGSLPEPYSVHYKDIDNFAR